MDTASSHPTAHPAASQPPHRHACIKCAYDVSDIDPHGTCPECNTPIIGPCITCEYDLSGTDPDAVCPECGTPVLCSIGNSALAAVPTELLKSVHTGFRLVTNGILIYIISVIVTTLVTVSMINNAGLSYPVTLISALINNAIVFAIIIGWFKLSVPLTNLPSKLDAKDKRSFVRNMLWIFAACTLITLFYGLIPGDPFETTLIDMIYGLFSLFLMAVMLALFISNVMYMGWFAKLVRNRKMARRAKHFVWYGPLIAVVGLFLFFIGPLITLVLYWNQIEYVRRDLKKIIKARADS